MARTDKFRKHHDEILAMAREINALLGDSISDATAETIRKLSARLAGLVGLHLAMEDKALYPELLSSSNQNVKATARRFSEEMGSIGAAFGAYMKKWSTTSAIKTSPSVFTLETKAIFNALSKRIHRENVELYVLLDEMQ